MVLLFCCVDKDCIGNYSSRVLNPNSRPVLPYAPAYLYGCPACKQSGAYYLKPSDTSVEDSEKLARSLLTPIGQLEDTNNVGVERKTKDILL